MTAPAYKRILLKLSGEVLMGDGDSGLAIDYHHSYEIGRASYE